MAVRMEVFSGDPPCPGCVAVLELADKYAKMYPEDELAIARYVGEDGLEKYREYNLSCVPAIVVNGTIKIEGICPDEGTLNNALREGGLCLR